MKNDDNGVDEDEDLPDKRAILEKHHLCRPLVVLRGGFGLFKDLVRTGRGNVRRIWSPVMALGLLPSGSREIMAESNRKKNTALSTDTHNKHSKCADEMFRCSRIGDFGRGHQWWCTYMLLQNKQKLACASTNNRFK